jgi:hypothetical protein
MTPFNAFRRNLTVKRRGVVTYDATTGLAVAGTSTTSTIKASVQPVGGNSITTVGGQMLQALAENRRALESYLIYTDSMLDMADETTGKQGDLIDIGGRDFEVQGVRIWQNGIINHNVYIVQRVML